MDRIFSSRPLLTPACAYCRLSQQDPSTAGYTLTHLVKALQLCLAAPSAGRAFRGNFLLQQATLAVAGLATLVVCRTQLTMDAEDDLQELLQVSGAACCSAWTVPDL